MLLLLLIVVAVCFVASLLPFLFPGALVSAVGVALNTWLGGFLATTLKVGTGSLLAKIPGAGLVPGGVALTFEGVLAVYLPVLILILFILRGR